MAEPKQLLFSFFLLLLSATDNVTSLPPTTHVGPLVSTHFIRDSCKVTLYPRLCYVSLATYAPVVKHDPIQLAAVAANVTLAHILRASSHVANIRRSIASAANNNHAVDPRTAQAIGDCVETLSDAVDLTVKSMSELAALHKAAGPEISWHVGNAQTWMSAALTNQDTCTDGFTLASGAGAQGPVVDDVTGRVELTKRYTSNALALVNSLVNG